MQYEIYISDYKKKKVVKLPILPTDLPAKRYSADSEEFLSVKNGYYNIIGSKSLIETSLEAMFPGAGKTLPFALSKKKGADLQTILLNAMDKRQPIWYMIVRSNGTYYLNTTVSITSYEVYEDKKTDWHFTLELKGWKKY